jgi:hypothetical protein
LAKKKYRHRKNIGFDKISLPAKYRRRKNIDIAKITVSTKYPCRQIIGIAEISVSAKYQWKLRWRVIKSVEIKVARYQIGGN